MFWRFEIWIIVFLSCSWKIVYDIDYFVLSAFFFLGRYLMTDFCKTNGENWRKYNGLIKRHLELDKDFWSWSNLLERVLCLNFNIWWISWLKFILRRIPRSYFVYVCKSGWYTVWFNNFKHLSQQTFFFFLKWKRKSTLCISPIPHLSSQSRRCDIFRPWKITIFFRVEIPVGNAFTSPK